MGERIKPVGARKRQRRKLQTPNDEVRARVLDAAAVLIAETGFPGLRIDELAARAGISVGTFYLYFEGKDDLFVQLVIGYTDRLLARFHESDAAGGSVTERLARRFDRYLDFVEENRDGFLYFRDSGAVDTTGGRLSAWAMNQHAADLQPLLAEGMAAGELRSLDSHLLAHAITGLFQHMVGVWLDDSENLTRDRVRRFLDDLLVFGTAPPRSFDGEGRR